MLVNVRKFASCRPAFEGQQASLSENHLTKQEAEEIYEASSLLDGEMKEKFQTKMNHAF